MYKYVTLYRQKKEFTDEDVWSELASLLSSSPDPEHLGGSNTAVLTGRFFSCEGVYLETHNYNKINLMSPACVHIFNTI